MVQVQNHKLEILRNSTFDSSDLAVDRRVGEGSFCHVFSVRVKKDSQHFNPCVDYDYQYAMKCPKKEDSASFVERVIDDLAIEIEILSQLDHSNIIKVRGVSSWTVPLSDRFLLLEFLPDTLVDRLKYWRRDRSNKKESMVDLSKRIGDISQGLSRGMAYLHSKKISHRDIKPHNIGFDLLGQVKLFDFGLAVKCDTRGVSNTEGFQVGSLRYMSPEMMLSQKIGFHSDVYSIGVVLYEIASLKKPFSSLFTTSEDVESILIQKVAKEEWRPSTSTIPSSKLRSLIKLCWHHSPLTRPSFAAINLLLEELFSMSLDESFRGSKKIGRPRSLSFSNQLKLPSMKKDKAPLFLDTTSHSANKFENMEDLFKQ
jgi:serine/threonine protein kinase